MLDALAPGITASFWHTGIVVPDLDRAMTELTSTTGAQWLPVQERPDGERTMRVTFSTQPPYIELIEGGVDGLWQTAEGPRLDHLAYWSEAYEADRANCEELGLQYEAGGTSDWGGNWSYYRLRQAGIRIELCDTKGRERFFRIWDLTP